MPEYLAPGVYVEETSFRARSIEGVGTSTTAFVGPTRKGPFGITPELVTSFGEFERMYGGFENLSFDASTDAEPPTVNYLAHAVRAYFDNGGARLYVSRTFTPRGPDDDGQAASVGFGPSGVASFVALWPGSAIGGDVIAQEKWSRASAISAEAAPFGTILRTGLEAGPQPATAVGGRPPFAVAPNQTLTVTVGEGATASEKEITFEGAAAFVDAQQLLAETLTLTDDVTIDVIVNGVTRTVTIPSREYENRQAVRDVINDGRLQGATAELANGTRLRFTTVQRGSGAQIRVSRSDTLGFTSVVSGSGTGNVGNLDAITVEEIAALLAENTAGPATASRNRNGQLLLTATDDDPTLTMAITGTAEGAFELDAVSGVPVAYWVKRANGVNGWRNADDSSVTVDWANQEARFVALTLTVREAGSRPGENETVFDDLAFDPAHPRWVGSILSEEPSRRSDQLTNPIAIRGAGEVDGLALRSALIGAPLNGIITLTPGNDGLSPLAASDLLPDGASYKEALLHLEAVEDVAIVAAPGSSDVDERDAIREELIIHAEGMRYRIAVLDSSRDLTLGDVRAERSAIDSTRAAFYYPWVVIANPLARPTDERIPKEIALPPSGFVTGIYARTDVTRGVWKAPANEVVRGALRFEREITFNQQETLNPEAINCLRFFYGRGNRVWGARTATSDPEWKYVNVRRYFIYLEHSIDRSMQWVVFEPNGEALWANVTETVSAFLYNEWRSGALLGSKPEEAFFVKCDRSTMTQNDLDNGRLICLIGVAPLKPAEFVIFRIGQKTADART